jgi:beta-glucosidase
MPWIDEVDAVLSAFLPGEAGGGAVYDLLTGAANPCGKLAESFAKKLSDTPSHLFFPGEGDASFYGESLFVGYRYYEKKQIEPLFAFGHGLSYTEFSYGAVRTEKSRYTDDEEIAVFIDVENIGALTGKEVVQLYVAPNTDSFAKPRIRPPKELKAFEKIELAPGERTTVRFSLGFRDFSFYDVEAGRLRVDTGTYTILVGSSSADIRAEVAIEVASSEMEKAVFTRDSLMGDICADERGRALLGELLSALDAGMRDKTGSKPGDDEAHMKMIMSMPLKTLILIGVPAEEVDGILGELNG